MDLYVPEIFQGLYHPYRYKIYHGGRGGAKSWSFADAILTIGGQRKTRILCAREIQDSIDESVKQLLDDRIKARNQQWFWRSTKKEIFGLNGSNIIFSGLYRNIDSIKSKEGIDICWIEEGDRASQESLTKLFPTIRKDGSEIWISFNPRSAKDPVYKRFLAYPEDNGPDTLVQQVNYYDNPWFTKALRAEMEWDKSHDPDKYNHVWLGQVAKISDEIVFSGKWRIDNFRPPAGTVFYYGADWGFANDPTTLVRCWVDMDKRQLFIDQEAWQIGCEIDHTPALFDKVPGSRKWVITGDSARPEIISYLVRNGFKIRKSKKGKGSVEDGVEFLRSFEIIVHERCKHTIDELSLYAYKVDKHTGDILPVIEDKNNHIIDPLRYATEKLRKPRVLI